MQSSKFTPKQLATLLRTQADEIDACRKALVLPQERYTLQEAIDRLAPLFPDYGTIEPCICWHSGQVDVEWKVYDGKQAYKGMSLSAVVDACLAAHAPASVDPVAEVQALLEQAQPMAF